jgi:hypothetical protein
VYDHHSMRLVNPRERRGVLEQCLVNGELC